MRFTDITSDAGIHFVHENGARGRKLLPETMGGGCAFLDYDADGDQDVLLVNSQRWPDDPSRSGTPEPTMALYRNDGRGYFEDVTAGSGLDVTIYGMAAAVGDYDNDGRVDVFVSAVGTNVLLHNEGHGRFRNVTAKARVGGDAHDWSTSSDGDVDVATLDRSGQAALWHNERGGKYVAASPTLQGSRLALAVGDVDRDGTFDLVSLLATGELRRASCNAGGAWTESRLLAPGDPSGAFSNAEVGAVFLAVADVDNNGAVDLIAGAALETKAWLGSADGQWEQLAPSPALHTTALADVDGNGLLDLVGLSDHGEHVALKRSQAGYGWHFLEPRANPGRGDNRINSFGIVSRTVEYPVGAREGRQPHQFLRDRRAHRHPRRPPGPGSHDPITVCAFRPRAASGGRRCAHCLAQRHRAGGV